MRRIWALCAIATLCCAANKLDGLKWEPGRVVNIQVLGKPPIPQNAGLAPLIFQHALAPSTWKFTIATKDATYTVSWTSRPKEGTLSALNIDDPVEIAFGKKDKVYVGFLGTAYEPKLLFKAASAVKAKPLESPQRIRAKAAAGDSASQYAVGYWYMVGQGVPQDYIEAVRWYRLAANAGHLAAQTTLGTMYQWGRGVEIDMLQAERLYRAAAERGQGQAQNNLAWFYWLGVGGLPKDLALAHMWFNLAAAQNVKDSPQDRDKVAAEMSAGQIIEAQRLAREWKPKP